MATAHQKIAVVVVLAALVGTMATGYAAYRGSNVARLRPIVWAMSALLLLQAALGIALAAGGNRPMDGLHFVYGPLLLFSLPVALLIARGRSQRDAGIVLTLGWLVTLVLSLRAVGTGGFG